MRCGGGFDMIWGRLRWVFIPLTKGFSTVLVPAFEVSNSGKERVTDDITVRSLN